MPPRLYRASQGRVVVCPVCDATFIAYDVRALYCSGACKQAMYRLRKKRRDARKRRSAAPFTDR